MYVVPRPGAALTEAAILAHCEAALPHAKRPREAILRAGLPKTGRGKLDRQALVADWRGRRQAAAPA